jgi:hypothetical protein
LRSLSNTIHLVLILIILNLESYIMTQANTPIQSADLDSILDATLDDLADVPEFKPFAAGTHLATLTTETKLIQNKAAVEWKLTLVEVLELANPEDVPPKAGDTCSGAFIFKNNDGTKNELAEGQFKEMLRPLQAHLGTTSNRETLEAAQGVQVAVTMTQRAGKVGSTSEGKFFPVVTSWVVA